MKSSYGVLKWTAFIGLVLFYSILDCPYSILGKYNNFGDADGSFAIWNFNWELSRLAALDLKNLYSGNIFFPLRKLSYCRKLNLALF
ncbi:MAG: hypothetical protein L7F77_03235 [Candidatus Magnetominusculus sp. LBB02]|nr:hypothetical protein [Candidatus Magnetominusculus sp. LBB02]